VRTLADLERLEPAWRGLAEAVQDRTVLSTFDYNATWYRHYGGDGSMLLGVARRGTDVVGIAPLVVRERRVGRIPLTSVEFNAHEAYAGEFLALDPVTIGAAFLESLTAAVRFDLVCLNGIDPDAPRWAAFRDAAGRSRLSTATTNHHNAIVELREGYDRYLQRRNSHFRSGVRRHARLIDKAGGATVEGVQLHRGLDTLSSSIDRMIAINEASYKLNGARLADCHRGFLGELARRFGPQGMLSLPILVIGGRDAAFIIGLVERGCFYDVTLCYDEAFVKLSPGSHLTQESLRQLAAAGVHTFVSHGAHEYKKLWADELVPSPRLFLFANTLRGRATRFVRFTLNPVWHRLGAQEP